VAGIYRPRPACVGHLSAVPTAQVDGDRHPGRTVLYRMLFHYFDQFLQEYESRLEKEYGFIRSIIKEVVAGRHEACKAVVISLCIALDRMRLPRRFAPLNDVSTAAAPAYLTP